MIGAGLAVRHRSPSGARERDRNERVPGARSLWIGLLVITLGVALPRFWYLAHGLPSLATVDESVVVSRADMLVHGHVPALYDWPSGSMMIEAVAIRVAGIFYPHILVSGSNAQYVLARVLSALAGSALCLATGTLAHQLCRKPGRRARIAAWCAALVVGVAYTAFRMSEYAHPEIEQALFATLSLVATATFVRRRQVRWAVAAGALAGVAGAIKYIGGFSLLPLLVAILLTRELSLRRRLVLAALPCAAASVVFIVLVPGAILRWSRFYAGVQGQFSHQATGHLGYDSTSPALWFHLTQSIPGSVGWPLTIAISCGTVVAAWKGNATARLTFLFAVVALGALGLSHVRFPHYVLVALPAVLALGFSGLTEVLPKGAAQYALGFAVAVALLPSAVSDARLIATLRDPSTQEAAAPIVRALDGRVFKEAYTDTSDVGQAVGTIASVPDVIDCHCYVVLSSYMESRYRLEPQRYAAEISVYDQLRRVGQVVADIRPAVPLSYRWDLLPQYGLDHVAFTRQLVGPEITVLKIP